MITEDVPNNNDLIFHQNRSGIRPITYAGALEKEQDKQNPIFGPGYTFDQLWKYYQKMESHFPNSLKLKQIPGDYGHFLTKMPESSSDIGNAFLCLVPVPSGKTYHWVLVFKLLSEPNYLLYYDSYGQNPFKNKYYDINKDSLERLCKYTPNANALYRSETDTQADGTSTCGLWCLFCVLHAGDMYTALKFLHSTLRWEGWKIIGRWVRWRRKSCHRVTQPGPRRIGHLFRRKVPGVCRRVLRCGGLVPWRRWFR